MNKATRIGWATRVLLSVLLPCLAQAGDGVVALQTADPACPDDSGDIYVDCGNGTVTDNRTGLVWLKDANCLRNAPGGGEVDWYTALEFVAGLKDTTAGSLAETYDCGLSDGSSPGEWRLPSLDEWEAMIADGRLLGCDPSITNDQGTACWRSDPLVCGLQGGTCSFSGAVSQRYWSSSPWIFEPAWVWAATLPLAAHAAVPKTFPDVYLWPVRGGQ